MKLWLVGRNVPGGCKEICVCCVAGDTKDTAQAAFEMIKCGDKEEYCSLISDSPEETVTDADGNKHPILVDENEDLRRYKSLWDALPETHEPLEEIERLQADLAAAKELSAGLSETASSLRHLRGKLEAACAAKDAQIADLERRVKSLACFNQRNLNTALQAICAQGAVNNTNLVLADEIADLKSTSLTGIELAEIAVTLKNYQLLQAELAAAQERNRKLHELNDLEVDVKRAQREEIAELKIDLAENARQFDSAVAEMNVEHDCEKGSWMGLVADKDAEIEQWRADLAEQREAADILTVQVNALQSEVKAGAHLVARLTDEAREAQKRIATKDTRKQLAGLAEQNIQLQAAMREALEETAEGLAFFLAKNGCCGEGDGKDHKADAEDYGYSGTLKKAKDAVHLARKKMEGSDIDER